MIANMLKPKIVCVLSIVFLAVLSFPAMALGATQLPQISNTYGYGLPGLDCPDGYDGPEDIYLYTGKEIKPKVHIYDTSNYPYNELIDGRDYDLSYANNINAGTATVTASGKGNYSGKATYQFYIEKRDISYYAEEYGDISLSDDIYAFTGKPIKPKVVSKKFKLGADFDVAYSNNVNPGKGIALITGKGLYGGTIKLTFKIKRLTSLKVKPVYNGTKKIVCTVSHAVVGDVVKLKIGKKSYTKKIKKLTTRQTFTFKVPKQKYGKKYTISVRSKSGSTLKKKTTKIWYTNKLRTGQTKTQVLYNPNWGAPSYKNVYSGYSGRQETWAYEYYDSDGNWYNTAYLYFRNGKLKGWNF